MDNELSKIKKYLGKLPAQYCIAYWEVDSKLVYEVLITSDEFEEIGDGFLEIASEYYREKKIRLFKDDEGSKPYGESWWTIIVGAIRIREVAYVIVARIPASDHEEVLGHIAEVGWICGLYRSRDLLRVRLVRFRKLVLAWVRKITNAAKNHLQLM
jgi:hypothetical protein